MRRIEQTNELLKDKLAHLVSSEIPLDNGLITISYVKCSPDFRYAKIVISVLPINVAVTVLEKLRKNSSLFAAIIRKETRLRKVPKFNWTIDSTEEKATEIEEVLKIIREERISKEEK